MKKFFRILSIIMWGLTFITSSLSLIVLFNGLDNAESAPQEAAVAAISVAFAVIPYCIARAISELRRNASVLS